VADTAMEFRILGPLEARDGDKPIALGPPKQRALLARLLLAPGRTIAVERATAGPAIRRQDVHPLHHADIFMIEGMAMGDKAAHSHRIEIRPKGN